MKLKIAHGLRRPRFSSSQTVLAWLGGLAMVMVLSACSTSNKNLSATTETSSAAKNDSLWAIQRFQLEFDYLVSPPESLAEAWYVDHVTRDSTHPYRPIPPEGYPNLGTVPPRPAGLTSGQRQAFLDSLQSDYQELWQTGGQARADQGSNPWRSFRATPDLPAPPLTAAAEASATAMVVQRAPEIDPRDAEIQSQLAGTNLSKIAVIYFATNQGQLNRDSTQVLDQIVAYLKANPYRLRLVAEGRMARARMATIKGFLIKAGVPARLIESTNSPAPSDADAVEVFTY